MCLCGRIFAKIINLLMPQPKYAHESLTVMTEMVLPNDTNTLNNLMGGGAAAPLDGYCRCYCRPKTL